jgi:hypothetical protein
VIPVPQRISAPGTPGDPRVPGDCVKCCVASILELPYEAVPHFVAGEWLVAPRAANGKIAGPPERVDWLSALNDWLRETGRALCATQTLYYKHPLPRGPVDSVLDWYESYDAPRSWSPGQGWWMASVISENFERSTHAIVMRDGDVAFDPSPKPRRTPYRFVGETHFIATEPALCRPAADRSTP